MTPPSASEDINKLWPTMRKPGKTVADNWDGKKEFNDWNDRWKETNNGDPKYFFGAETSNRTPQVKTYFDGHLTEDGVENFTSKWYNDSSNIKSQEQRPVPKLNPKMMEKFVDYSFQNWGWSSNKQFKMDLEHQRKIMKEEIGKAKNDRTQISICLYYTDLLKAMKKERRYFRKQFEENYKLGNPAAVRALKYDMDTDTFTALCVYEMPNKESGEIEEIEEEMEVSDEWLKNAGFAQGVVQHVII